MSEDLRSILERGFKVIYDGEGYLKRIEWKDSLEEKLAEYFSHKEGEK